MSVIQTDGLTKAYGQSRGITDVDLKVDQGEIYGFIGPNGAGKSTTIKLLLNLIYPTAGSATLFGLDVVRDTEKIKRKIGYVPGEVRYYPDMTPLQLLKTTLAFQGKMGSGCIDELCATFEIDRHKKFGELSLGNKKKVAIATALIHEPELLILDEPTNGLDPLMQKRLFEVLKERNKAGATIFVSSHNLNEVQAHCTRAAFIKDGRIIRAQDLTQERNRSKTVTITAAALDAAPFAQIGAKAIVLDGQTITFVYDGPMGPLAKLIAALNPADLLIESASLESEFLSYYEGGEQP